jgi:hypothetical protein
MNEWKAFMWKPVSDVYSVVEINSRKRVECEHIQTLGPGQGAIRYAPMRVVVVHCDEDGTGCADGVGLTPWNH